MTTIGLQVPLSKQSLIIGSGGSTIQFVVPSFCADFRNIQNTCSVAVIVPKKEENVTTVSIVGSAEGLKKAQDMIEEIIRKLKLLLLILQR
jgi:hypothetical protein